MYQCICRYHSGIYQKPPICLRPTGTLAKGFGVSSAGAQCKRIAGQGGIYEATGLNTRFAWHQEGVSRFDRVLRLLLL